MFQAPSLDKKLTVAENLRHQGHLYGLLGRTLAGASARCSTGSAWPTARDDASKRSPAVAAPRRAGQGHASPAAAAAARRAEHGARSRRPRDLWNYLRAVRERDGVTVVLTTHLLEEADKADRIGDPARRQARGARHARRAAGHGRRRFDHDRHGRSAGAGRRDRASASAAPRASSTARVRLEQPDGHRVDRPAGRGVSRPDRVDHAWASRRWKTCSSPAPGTASGSGRQARRPMAATHVDLRCRSTVAARDSPTVRAAPLAGRRHALPARIGPLLPPAEPRVRRDRPADHVLAAVRRGAGPVVPPARQRGGERVATANISFPARWC